MSTSETAHASFRGPMLAPDHETALVILRKKGQIELTNQQEPVLESPRSVN